MLIQKETEDLEEGKSRMAIKKLLTKSFLTRTLSAVLLVVITLITVLTGGDLLLLVTLFASVVGLYEMYRVISVHHSNLALVGYISTILYYVLIRFTGDVYIHFFIILYLLLVLAFYVFSFPKYKTEQMLMIFFGVIYVSVFMSFIYLVRETSDGKYAVWLIFICSWICDTFAYLFGVTLGKHKMSPVLSPKKSVEGAIGGVLGAVLVGAAYGYILDMNMFNSRPKHFAITFALIAFAGALLSMIGDLAASAIKRNYNIKDYGKLIPGHGGIIDRFDSVLVTAPVVYIGIRLVKEFIR